jgi:hypothetical protein
MKKLLIIFGVVLLAGCGEVDNMVNSIESSTGLLDRTVTLYANDGHAIKLWRTKNHIEYQGPITAFIDDQGINVRVSGTFIVEGK